MGTCYSSPVVLSRRPRPLNSISSDNSLWQSFAAQLISVLKDPSGDDLSRRYQIGKELGREEFSVTYRCTDVETKETLACKSIAKSRLKMQIDVEDVRQEVEIMRRLPRHPNIVSLEEAYEDGEAVHGRRAFRSDC